ncbi:DUF4288 domain-containing protein [Pontibacter diazotrophicus]|uniref:DUF4288 domain-containing protein n=1 Tax=Pontibacter diazotrophicus TaxID=1400979 RepID=A0A3D8L9Y7_9BACT|nr:DUF4288 domain-containing protein [Pontibacter diazotrophicus]RDV14241.1 DUF4288 domain-containing protein [Pontibacter diazotrophicus]
MDEFLSQWKIDPKEARQSEKTATITIVLKYVNTDNFMEIPPDERKAIIRRILQQQYARLKKDFSLRNIKLERKRTEPRVLEAQMKLKDLFDLQAKEYVLNIIVKDIEGIARVESKEGKEEKPDAFYAVKARYAILIEGITSGLQTYEERIVLLKAKNEEEAEKKALKILPAQEQPYLGSEKRYVWYKFEEIINIQETHARELSDFNEEGIEIYSERKVRRMRPGDEWILPYRPKQ